MLEVEMEWDGYWETRGTLRLGVRGGLGGWWLFVERTMYIGACCRFKKEKKKRKEKKR